MAIGTATVGPAGIGSVVGYQGQQQVDCHEKENQQCPFLDAADQVIGQWWLFQCLVSFCVGQNLIKQSV
jgi:hypothetical protein